MNQVNETILLEPLRITDQILIQHEDGTLELNSFGTMVAFISKAIVAKPNEDIKTLRIESEPFDANKLTAALWKTATCMFFDAIKENINEPKKKLKVKLPV